MKTIKGPAIFLAQFAGGGPHLQNFNDMAKWAKECGFIGVQLPSWDGRVMDLQKAAESKTYCDELRGTWPDTASRSPSLPRTCRASWWPCIRPTTCSSTTSRQQKCTAIRSARPGP